MFLKLNYDIIQASEESMYDVILAELMGFALAVVANSTPEERGMLEKFFNEEATGEAG